MTRRNVLVVSFVMSLAFPALGAAPKKAEKGDPSRDAVIKVLRHEMFATIDRRSELQEILAKYPDANLARWHSGYVREKSAWRPAERAGSANEVDETLHRYRERREAAPQTSEGQIELANWCRTNKLPDQERAHLIAAMTLAPDEDHSQIYERLGYRLVGDHWLSQHELAEWQDSNRRALAAVKHWGARLEKVAEKLDGSPRQHEVGVASLKQWSDVDVIPAMECVLCGRDEAAALAAVDAFQKVDGYEGTVALAKQAVFSQWPNVREKAANLLKGRRLDDFVPALIGLLATPVTVKATSQWAWFEEPGGTRCSGVGTLALTRSYILARETDDQFQVQVLNNFDFRLNDLLAGSVVHLRGGFRITSPGEAKGARLETRLKAARNANDVDRTVATEEYERSRVVEAAVDAVNERTADLNRRIVAVLATVSDRDPSPQPPLWWKWWADTTDTQQTGGKNVVIVSENEVQGDPTLRLRRMSCFIAGTPVWTEDGPVAIEAIKVGDRVLSQNIETGELAYKPVLRTTVRPAKPLVRVKVGEETITATGGHRFWAAGDGWTKARDLKAQSLVHTVAGNATIASVEPGPTAETYNLVVADAHDYFVGRAGLLVQDLPLPQPTNSIVPGLTHRQLTTSGH